MKKARRSITLIPVPPGGVQPAGAQPRAPSTRPCTTCTPGGNNFEHTGHLTWPSGVSFNAPLLHQFLNDLSKTVGQHGARAPDAIEPRATTELKPHRVVLIAFG